MTFPRLNIEFCAVGAQRFTTLGDWWENADGSFEIRVTDMPDFRHTVAILMHELIEWAVCQWWNVKTIDCDDFDRLWEEELSAGLHKVEEEAGFDRRCPYRAGHVWGCRLERLVIFILRGRWKEYLTSCDEETRKYGG